MSIQLKDSSNNNLYPIPPNDYIVEQGTSGDWTYRKWASGIAECWGMQSGTLPAEIPWGSTYGSATNAVPTVNYPESFFIETPILTYGIGSSNGNYTLITDDTRQPSKTRTAGFSLWRGTSSASVNYVIYYHAIGKWK